MNVDGVVQKYPHTGMNTSQNDIYDIIKSCETHYVVAGSMTGQFIVVKYSYVQEKKKNLL